MAQRTGGGVISGTGAQPDGTDPLLDGVGFLLARGGGRAIRMLNKALEPYNLRARQHSALVAAAATGDLSQRRLAELLGMEPSAVVALVDDLERAGLVQRQSHPTDRRTRVVAITPQGRSALRDAAAAARTVNDELLADLSRSERDTLISLLTRVALD